MSDGRTVDGHRQSQGLRAPLEEIEEVAVSERGGIEGDARGIKKGRQITILFREGWEDACRELDAALPWAMRRANLYVEGLGRPRGAGSGIVLGDVILVVVQETRPCELMERAHRGLRRALAPDWRGGVCCDVARAGKLHIIDAVILSSAIQR